MEEHLHGKILDVHKQMSEFESKVAMAKGWVSGVMAQPSLLTAPQLCLSRIGEVLGWTSEAGTDFIEFLAKKVAVGCGHSESEQVSWIATEFPMTEILRQAFLLQKEVEDRFSSFSKQHHSCKRKLEKLNLTSERQKKKSEVALDSAESKLQQGEDPQERSIRLSKRNAMNRAHTSVAKIRKERSSDQVFAEQAHVETCLNFESMQTLAGS